MKRLIAVMGVIAAAASLSTPAFAVFTVTQSSTVRASVTVGGPQEATFTMLIRKAANIAQVSNAIGWTNAVRADGWKISDDMLLLNHSVSDADGGIRVFTNNTAADANPRAVDPTSNVTTNLDSDPGGLRLVSNPALSIPIAWTIKTATQTIGTSLQPSDPNSGAVTGPGNKFQWLFVVDRQKPAIDLNGDGDQTDTGEPAYIYNQPVAYSDMVRANGIHFGSGDGDFAPDPDNLSFAYFQANMGAAGAGGTYTSNKIIVEGYTQ